MGLSQNRSIMGGKMKLIKSYLHQSKLRHCSMCAGHTDISVQADRCVYTQNCWLGTSLFPLQVLGRTWKNGETKASCKAVVCCIVVFWLKMDHTRHLKSVRTAKGAVTKGKRAHGSTEKPLPAAHLTRDGYPEELRHLKWHKSKCANQ